MGSQTIIPISTYIENIKVLHIEPTNVCQAACPLCERELDSRFNKNDHKFLSVDILQQLIDDSFIKKLDKMFMCGNYGDPAAADIFPICDFFRDKNPEITLGMNTNGGLRNINWWADLAKKFNQSKDYVVFSIDGLSDTNHIYRKNVDWTKVIDNAQAFINAGGKAHWDMLIYAHNEHQVKQAEIMAKDLGFTWFRAKLSRRASSISWLKPPIHFAHTEKNIKKDKIVCHALKEKSIYIDCKGIVYPCCWLGMTEYTLKDFDHIQNSWDSKSIKMCDNVCSSVNDVSIFNNQWIIEKQLC